MSLVTYILTVLIIALPVFPVTWLIFNKKRKNATSEQKAAISFAAWILVCFIIFFTNWWWLIDEVNGVNTNNTMLLENGKIVRTFSGPTIVWQGSINMDSLVSFDAYTKTIKITLPLEQTNIMSSNAGIEYVVPNTVIIKEITWQLSLTIGGSPESTFQFYEMFGKYDSCKIAEYLKRPLKELMKDEHQSLLVAYNLFYGEDGGVNVGNLTERYLLFSLISTGIKINKPNTNAKFTSS